MLAGEIPAVATARKLHSRLSVLPRDRRFEAEYPYDRFTQAASLAAATLPDGMVHE
ncbi:unnamed protein product [marine sediment metagenome]|uniref:Uncharacterized protein n=1 Tax=marine sediment metagenome TaxID=412755 RepID=X1CBI6_9ZZZZ